MHGYMNLNKKEKYSRGGAFFIPLAGLYNGMNSTLVVLELGLHCATGLPTKDETEKTTQRSKNMTF